MRFKEWAKQPKIKFWLIVIGIKLVILVLAIVTLIYFIKTFSS